MQSMCDTGTAVGAAWNFQVKPAGTVIASGNGSKRDWVAGGGDNLLGETGDKFQVTPSASYQSTDSADTTSIASNSCGISAQGGGAPGMNTPGKEKVAQKIYAIEGVAVRAYSTVPEVRFDTKIQAANSTNWRVVA